MNSKIRVDNLHAGYAGVEILRGISLALPVGGFVGVIGPNGSGKTTLLRTISRALPPITGSVFLDGREVYSIPAREFAQRVAVVSQETFVAFDFSVIEIVLMGRSPRLGRFAVEGNKDLKIALDALAQTGTAHLKDRPITALSGGERQRVMMARALAQEPEVILLDEPTSHLDISFQFEIMDLVKSLNRTKCLTVLAVLHDLNLAGQYCDRLVMIGQGKIQADGAPDQVITSDNIRRVYGAEVWIRRHPATGRPYVISGVKKKTKPLDDHFDRAPKVHVIGGGGTAAPVLARLARRGYQLTCGVLGIGDADQEVSEALDVSYVPMSLFEHISPEAHSEHLKLVADADCVLLTDVPVGNGNLANVDAALEAARLGKPVVVLKPDLIKERDFTDGRASALVDELIATGAVTAGSMEEALQALEHSAK